MPLPRILVTAVAVTLALSLSGCVGEARGRSSPNASKTWASPFASKKDALAAANRALQDFLDVDAAIAASPSLDLSAVNGVAVGQAAEQEMADTQRFRDQGISQTGSVSFDNQRFESGRSGEDGNVVVTTFACIDYSDTRAISQSGEDVTPADRNDRVEMKFEYTTRNPESRILVLQGSELWSYDGAC
ncbi:hypothetical protein HQQ80_11660 [Microbacteriaceae bacterium VKM Ac-2855]|nr:hypothetical protein [Microbacteriaceae bacterium VKM Ac-2855]